MTERPQPQPLVRSSGGRLFACSPAAVLVYIIDEAERFLLLRHPQRDGWEIVNGALDAGETVLDGALREAAEEAGASVRLRPLGAVHVQSFHYDANVRYMLSLMYLMVYERGTVQPGDDMAGSEARWFTVEELSDEELNVIVPPHSRWLFARARDLYRLWKDEDVLLQRPLPEQAVNKYVRRAISDD